MAWLVALPLIVIMVIRAVRNKSLTPLGLGTGILTALAHGYHPWSIFVVQLAAFFVMGSAATKYSEHKKAELIQDADTVAHQKKARTHVQVLANSGVATVLVLIHAYYLNNIPDGTLHPGNEGLLHVDSKFFTPYDALPYVVAAVYCAVTADTLSSELGILSEHPPFLITDILGIMKGNPRQVEHGTNGGVSVAGLWAAKLGSGIVSLLLFLVPLANAKSDVPWTAKSILVLCLCISLIGSAGSVIDSLLGALLQASVRDKRTGKIVEAQGGGRVPHAGNIRQQRVDARTNRAPAQNDGSNNEIVVGRDLLTNNQINFLMTVLVALGTYYLVTLWRFIPTLVIAVCVLEISSLPGYFPTDEDLAARAN